jgi:arylsulfatase
LRGIASRHGYRVEKTGLALYNLKSDEGERHNMAEQHPDVVQRLLTLADLARDDLGDSLTHRKGKGVRPCAVEN